MVSYIIHRAKSDTFEKTSRAISRRSKRPVPVNSVRSMVWSPIAAAQRGEGFDGVEMMPKGMLWMVKGEFSGTTILVIISISIQGGRED